MYKILYSRFRGNDKTLVLLIKKLYTINNDHLHSAVTRTCARIIFVIIDAG